MRTISPLSALCAFCLLSLGACAEQNDDPAATSDGGDAAAASGGGTPVEAGAATGGNGTGGTVGDAGIDAGDSPVASSCASRDARWPTDSASAPNILIVGSGTSIESIDLLQPQAIAEELQAILDGDSRVSAGAKVVAEDVYTSKAVDFGLGQSNQPTTWQYFRHSLLQYYHWPEARDARLRNLEGNGSTDWDYVVLLGDPAIITRAPGYHALGVHQVAERIAAGAGRAVLFVPWAAPAGDGGEQMLTQVGYRIARGAAKPLPLAPGAAAWSSLPAQRREEATAKDAHYFSASLIYALLLGRSAETSSYGHDDALAAHAHQALQDMECADPGDSALGEVTPFSAGDVYDAELNYNHTGTSSERGILRGLRTVVGKTPVALVEGGTPPIDFNFGRANTYFEESKQYRIDADQFRFSLGFPMQDHGEQGDTSMLYGLDRRLDSSENGTDLGVALKMIREQELPEARAIPIRSLFAQMRDVDPSQSAYGDAWHMHSLLDRSTAAYIYTLLTGHCPLGMEPGTQDSPEWRAWTYERIGYETAWTLMHWSGAAPGFQVGPETPGTVALSTEADERLLVRFVFPLSADVSVTVSSSDESSVQVSPSELRFTPEDYDQSQAVTLRARPGTDAPAVTLTLRTTSSEARVHAVVDRWRFQISP